MLSAVRRHTCASGPNGRAVRSGGDIRSRHVPAHKQEALLYPHVRADSNYPLQPYRRIYAADDVLTYADFGAVFHYVSFAVAKIFANFAM